MGIYKASVGSGASSFKSYQLSAKNSEYVESLDDRSLLNQLSLLASKQEYRDHVSKSEKQMSYSDFALSILATMTNSKTFSDLGLSKKQRDALTKHLIITMNSIGLIGISRARQMSFDL